MAQETRAQLYAKILANLPDNTTEQITPATDRAVEDAEVESCFNLLDDEATDVNYNPTNTPDWLPEGDPSEVGEGLDILAARTGVNLSQSIAYVSNDGNNAGVTPELGNPLKPFLTIQAAATALPTTNGILKVLGGGTYTEDVTLKSNSVNCVFDFGNCTIVGILTTNTPNGIDGNILMNLRNENNSLVSVSNFNCQFIYNIKTSGFNAPFVGAKFVLNCEFITSAGGASSLTTSGLTNQRKYWTNCIIKSLGTQNTLSQCAYTNFYNCEIEANTGIGILAQNPSVPETSLEGVLKLYNCTVKTNGNNSCVGDVNIMAYNTKFYAADYPTILTNGGVYKYLLFDNCEFYTKTIYASFQMQGSGSVNRTALENYTFKNCVFHTNAGFPVLEPASYNVSDAGTTLLVNCVYNAISATSATAVKVTEHNSFSFPNYTDFNNLQ